MPKKAAVHIDLRLVLVNSNLRNAKAKRFVSHAKLNIKTSVMYLFKVSIEIAINILN